MTTTKQITIISTFATVLHYTGLIAIVNMLGITAVSVAVWCVWVLIVFAAAVVAYWEVIK